MATRISDDAQIAGDATIGDGTQVWNLVQIRERAAIGATASSGAPPTSGSACGSGPLQDPEQCPCLRPGGDRRWGVHRPGDAILTNDRLPRAISPNSGNSSGADDWDSVGVTIFQRPVPSIGRALSAWLPVDRIGAWAMVAAGSVVVRDVPDHALSSLETRLSPDRVWVGRDGQRMVADGGALQTPRR